jgi:hypothetical protein
MTGNLAVVVRLLILPLEDREVPLESLAWMAFSCLQGLSVLGQLLLLLGCDLVQGAIWCDLVRVGLITDPIESPQLYSFADSTAVREVCGAVIRCDSPLMDCDPLPMGWDPLLMGCDPLLMGCDRSSIHRCDTMRH